MRMYSEPGIHSLLLSAVGLLFKNIVASSQERQAIDVTAGHVEQMTFTDVLPVFIFNM